MVGGTRLNQSPLFVYAYIFRTDYSLGIAVTTARFHHICLLLSGFQPSEFLPARNFLWFFVWVSFLVAYIPLPPPLFCFSPFPVVYPERIVSVHIACNRRRRSIAYSSVSCHIRRFLVVSSVFYSRVSSSFSLHPFGPSSERHPSTPVRQDFALSGQAFNNTK